MKKQQIIPEDKIYFRGFFLARGNKKSARLYNWCNKKGLWFLPVEISTGM